MRILIADKLASFIGSRLEALGAEVAVEPALAGDALTARLAELDPEVLIVRSTAVTPADVAAAPELSLVIRAGAGVNTIALDACSARGVYVANCPGKNAVAVAELTMAHLLNLDRRVADNVAALRGGRWDKKSFGTARGLSGTTLAILGFGHIGREVAQRARAFEMRVVVWSRSLDDATAAAAGVERAASPEDAVRDADAVTVHLALTTETAGRIGATVFAAMKPGALFVNTARAEVIDEKALLEAIESKNLRAGLDVFDGEPSAGQAQVSTPSTTHASIYGTHHIGASTDQAESAVCEEVIHIVTAYRDGAPIPNCVNLASHTPATHLLVVRHQDRVGVLAGVLDVLREAGHNVQDMQNVVFAGAEAAVARIGIVGKPTPETMSRIARNGAIFAASVTPLSPPGGS
jgi:D-3-phosphoglycerate dehydrogenase